LFGNKITGRVEDSVGVSLIEGMSPVDAMKLEASLGTLRSQFPSVRVEDVDLGNNRLHKSQSDAALFKKCKYLFASIKWDNVGRGLSLIPSPFRTREAGAGRGFAAVVGVSRKVCFAIDRQECLFHP
jgi:hypothetical protein